MSPWYDTQGGHGPLKPPLRPPPWGGQIIHCVCDPESEKNTTSCSPTMTRGNPERATSSGRWQPPRHHQGFNLHALKARCTSFTVEKINRCLLSSLCEGCRARWCGGVACVRTVFLELFRIAFCVHTVDPLSGQKRTSSSSSGLSAVQKGSNFISATDFVRMMHYAESVPWLKSSCVSLLQHYRYYLAAFSTQIGWHRIGNTHKRKADTRVLSVTG